MPTGLLGAYFPGEDPMAPVDLMPRGLLGPSVLGRMQAHSDAQRQRMAAGDYSPTPMDEDAMWLADDLAGGLLGSLPGGVMGAIKAYHGSPHRFDRFDMSKIGTGEGAQAYGSGLYFAESPDVARQYKQQLEVVSEEPFRALGIPDKDIPQAVSLARSTHPAAMDVAARDFSDWTGFRRDDALVDAFKRSKQPGALYTTRLDVEPEDLLDWDAPLSQQSEKVRAALKNVDAPYGNTGFTVRDVIETIEVAERDPKAAHLLKQAPFNENARWLIASIGEQKHSGGAEASRILREAGIPGIRYLDQGSRASGDGTRNFVIFDDKLIDIEAVE